jgi:hypothetical protein
MVIISAIFRFIGNLILKQNISLLISFQFRTQK